MTVEVVAVMLIAFALSLAAMSAWAQGPIDNPRLDLTLTKDCGNGVALYRDTMGNAWLWRGGLGPASIGAACPG